MKRQEELKFDKYSGALLGAAIGDALGWPNEYNSKNISKVVPTDKEVFQKWTRRSSGRFWSHYEEINPGEYSDDTQLIIATARSLQYGNSWSKYFTKIELPAWLSYERGGGGATKRAADVWIKGNTPWKVEKGNINEVKQYFNAGGNGVAMRILPHIFGKEEKIDEVMHQVVLNGIITHGHPRALVGATLYADALIYLSNNKETLGYGELIEYLIERKEKWSKFPSEPKMDNWIINADEILKVKYIDIWNSVVEEVIDLLKIAKEGLDRGALDMGNGILERLGCFDKKVNGAGTVTAVSAIYLASKYASSPRLALAEAAYLKGADTDTLASMVGALLGMLHGTEFISVSWLDVQDYEYLKGLIHLKTYENESISELKGELLDCTNNAFKTKLKQLKVGDTIEAMPFNILTIKEKKLNKSNSNGAIVHTLKLASEEGQSIFIKTFEKTVEEKTAQIQKNLKTETISQQTMNNKTLDTTKYAYIKESVKTIDKRVNKPFLDANKIRSLANILPENMPSDQCFFFISDIMMELERSATGKIDEVSLNILLKRWSKHNITTQNIGRVLNVILNY